MDELTMFFEERIFTTKKPISGVYFLFDGDDLVYIGKSIECRARIESHKKTKKFDSYHILQMQESEIDEAEKKYISKYKPRYNTFIPGKRRVVDRVEVPSVQEDYLEWKKREATLFGF